MNPRLLIDGRLVAGDLTLPVVNPATGEVFAQCSRASRNQLELAVSAADQSLPSWRRTEPADRLALIEMLASKLEQRTDTFAQLVTREQGKPLSEAMWEVGAAVDILRCVARLSMGDKPLFASESERIFEQRTPLGVVAAILPWNAPLFLLCVKLGPALFAGNTMVVKPAPTTPLSTLLLGEMAAEIFPAGVLNIIVDADDLGDALTSHPVVRKVAFTGSVATGRNIMRSSAATLKRLTLELGGNDPAIVLDDADLDDIVPKLFASAMFNAGQACIAIKRLFLPATLYDRGCDMLADLAKATVLGNGLDPDTTMGPVQNKKQFERCKGFLDTAWHDGKVIAGGHALDRSGFFIQPTIVRDIADNSRLVAEEQFGPILPVLSYQHLDEAIERANDTDFGLGATVWSGDPQRALTTARAIEAGMVWVNRHFDVRSEFAIGGAKQSGIGRELGMEGLHEYTQPKYISAALT